MPVRRVPPTERRAGQTGHTARHILRTVVLVAALFLTLLLISRRPGFSGLILAVLTAGLVAAALGQQALEAARALRRRTRLAIAGILGDGRPRDRSELIREVRLRVPTLRHPPMSWLRLEAQALEALTRQGLLVQRDGKYSAAELLDP